MLGQTVIEPAHVAFTDPKSWGRRTVHSSAGLGCSALHCVSGDGPEYSGKPGGQRFRNWDPGDWMSLADWLRGVDHFNNGMFWEAHEEWERLWRAKQKGSTEEVFTQGMIQIAAALVQISRGSAGGARSLAKKSLEKIERVADRHSSFMGLDLAQVVADFRNYFGPLETRVLPPLDASVPKLELSGVAAG